MSESKFLAMIEKLTDEASELRDTAGILAQARRRLLFATLIVIGVTLAISIVLIVIILRVVGVQETLECFTVPGEPCYERSQEQQSQVIQRIIDGQVVSSFCARGAETVKEAQTCVDEILDSGSG
jgi:hypothetical protein